MVTALPVSRKYACYDSLRCSSHHCSSHFGQQHLLAPAPAAAQAEQYVAGSSYRPRPYSCPLKPRRRASCECPCMQFLTNQLRKIILDTRKLLTLQDCLADHAHIAITGFSSCSKDAIICDKFKSRCSCLIIRTSFVVTSVMLLFSGTLTCARCSQYGSRAACRSNSTSLPEQACVLLAPNSASGWQCAKQHISAYEEAPMMETNLLRQSTAIPVLQCERRLFTRGGTKKSINKPALAKQEGFCSKSLMHLCQSL